MAKKARKKRPRKANAPPRETRAVEVLTVSWMLAVMTAFLCEVAGTIARLLVDRYPGVALLAGYLLFAAAVVGGVSLIMLAFVYRLRKVKPPPGIVFFASVVGAAPLIVLLFSWLQGRG